MSPATLSRRSFLKLSGTAALGLAIARFDPTAARAAGPPPGSPDGAPSGTASGAASSPPAGLSAGQRLGRTTTSMNYYDRPSLSGQPLGFYNTDAVVNILEKRIGDPQPAHNPFWLRTDDGWIHSSYVQPVQDRENAPVTGIPPGGFLAEVTVPYTQSWKVRNGGPKRAYRFYYGTTHWVHYMETDSFGEWWYRITDDLEEEQYLVPAKDLRPIQPEEITPLSPGVPGKRLEVNLAAQRLTAFEGRRIVFTARVSTGYGGTGTPAGEFLVERKQPSRHMAANEAGGNGYDLPGVPWCCFIFWSGISTHGTYWHNNYGAPMSHGCINLLPEAAKWIYRWTDPVVPFGDNYVESDAGTPVLVY